MDLARREMPKARAPQERGLKIGIGENRGARATEAAQSQTTDDVEVPLMREEEIVHVIEGHGAGGRTLEIGDVAGIILQKTGIGAEATHMTVEGDHHDLVIAEEETAHIVMSVTDEGKTGDLIGEMTIDVREGMTETLIGEVQAIVDAQIGGMMTDMTQARGLLVIVFRNIP